ncbi:MAG TPA: hypothetical protein VJ965_02585 [Anaerolineales bacterium]|nr:hypothetical protein [Anaerolineales bacterium]
MTEENNDTHTKQEQYQKKFDPVVFILGLVLVGVLVILAMRFLAPTIGNVYPYPYMDESGYLATSECDCTISRNKWGNEVLIGKLVVILPKTMVYGEPYQAFAFSYSPEKYSDDEIDEYLQSFLEGMGLSEDMANIQEGEVIMNTSGFPMLRANAAKSFTDYFFDRTIQFIDPENVTVWNMKTSLGNDWWEGLYYFVLSFSYSRVGSGSVFCGRVCLPNNFPVTVIPSSMEVNLVLQDQTSE